METIKCRGVNVQIPTSVSELLPEQYEYYCFLASALAVGAITPDCFRVRWLSYLAGLGKIDFTKLKKPFADEMAYALPLIDRFFIKAGTDDSPVYQLELNSVVNLLPSYKGFSGPGDMLQGITFGDFIECSSILEALENTDEHDVKEGCRQIARILYKIPENEDVPELLMFHAPRFFINVWKFILDNPVEINGRKIDFRIIFKKVGKSRPDDKTGWMGITFEVATAGLFGKIPDVRNSDFWEVMIYLYKCKFEYINETKENH